MYNAIWAANSQQFTKLNSSTALSTGMAGELPQRAEVRLLEDMFGIDLARALLKHTDASFSKLVGQTALEVANLPRAILS